MRDVLRTALCDLLGIEYPIIQSGMANVAGSDLVAEVSRAGGLGILAGLGVPPDELRARIRHVRERTDRPFGVNLWLHTELRPPADPTSISDERLAAVQGVLNGFRAELGLPAQSGRPPAIPDLIPAQIEMLLEERLRRSSASGWATRRSEVVERCHERGIKVIAMVATVEDARTVAGVRRRCGHRPGQRGRRPPLDVGEAAVPGPRQRRDPGAGASDRGCGVGARGGRGRHRGRPWAGGDTRPRGGGHPPRDPLRGHAGTDGAGVLEEVVARAGGGQHDVDRRLLGTVAARAPQRLHRGVPGLGGAGPAATAPDPGGPGRGRGSAAAGRWRLLPSAGGAGRRARPQSAGRRRGGGGDRPRGARRAGGAAAEGADRVSAAGRPRGW